MNGFNLILAISPLVTGYLVIRGIIYYSKKEYSARGISPSYFGAVALLFALFASLVFGEVWSRVTRINYLMLSQANALRGLLRVTENLPAASGPYQQTIQEYIKAITAMETANEGAIKDQDVFSNATFHPLYSIATDSTRWQGHAVLQQAVLNKTDALRNDWFERKELLKQRILPEKMLVLFLMGFFTQVSIAFSHLGNDRGIRDTVGLFSMAFFAAMVILLVIDDTGISRQFLSIAALKDVH